MIYYIVQLHCNVLIFLTMSATAELNFIKTVECLPFYNDTLYGVPLLPCRKRFFCKHSKSRVPKIRKIHYFFLSRSVSETVIFGTVTEALIMLLLLTHEISEYALCSSCFMESTYSLKTSLWMYSIYCLKIFWGICKFSNNFVEKLFTQNITKFL